MTRYVALLRGINVGGRNPVPMAELRGVFEAAGFEAVGTYIQSGNVIFETDARAASLEDRIERMLHRRLELPVVVVVRSRTRLRHVVQGAPDEFGAEPDRYLYDVVFLKAPLSAAQALRVVDPRPGVDQAWPGTGALYLSRLAERRSQSRFSRIAGTPEYQRMTIRNWNTTTRLLDLVDRA